MLHNSIWGARALFGGTKPPKATVTTGLLLRRAQVKDVNSRYRIYSIVICP